VWLLLLLFLVFEGYANVTPMAWAANLEVTVEKPLTLPHSSRLTEGIDLPFLFCHRILSRSFRKIRGSFRELCQPSEALRSFTRQFVPHKKHIASVPFSDVKGEKSLLLVRIVWCK
jgi:hypothetical protein